MLSAVRVWMAAFMRLVAVSLAAIAPAVIMAGTAFAASLQAEPGPPAYTYDYPATLESPDTAGVAGPASPATVVVEDFQADSEAVSGFGVAAKSADELGDGVVLVRGGTNTADRFAGGSGVTSDAAGNLSGISVNSGRTVEEAAHGIKNNQIGVSTVGDVRRAGGTVTRDPTPYNANRCLISGCTADVFSDLFTPTIKNPWK